MHRDLRYIFVVYLAALGAGVGAAWAAAAASITASAPIVSAPIALALIADIAATGFIFLCGWYARNSSLYDPFWSVAPPAIAIYWMSALAPIAPREAIACALILIWAARLTFNWARRWNGRNDEDWRYQNIRALSGRWFPLADLFGIQLMPTLLVFAALAPFYAVAASDAPLNWIDAAAAIVMLSAIAIEAAADQQLRRFLKQSPRKGGGEILSQGLWRYARHPNYLGEIMFWWGLFAFALAAGGSPWLGAGAAAINLLFVFVSVPLMNQRGRQRRPNYDAHIKRTRALIPLPKMRNQ